VKKFLPGLTERWLQALERPEAEIKVQAALAIAAARQRNMPGLEGTVGPPLRLLDAPAQDPAVRLAAARALVTLDAEESAPVLLRLAESGDVDLREIAEPALARWDHAPARGVWLERLAQPPRGRGTLLAIQGLAAVREEKAAPRLRELV